MPSKKELIFIALILFAGALIGFGLGWKMKQPAPVNEDNKFTKIYQQIDSLKLIIKTDNAHIDTIYGQIKAIDINRNNNFKNLANELNKVRRFTTTTRSKYLDSLAAVEGL